VNAPRFLPVIYGQEDLSLLGELDRIAKRLINTWRRRVTSPSKKGGTAGSI